MERIKLNRSQWSYDPNIHLGEDGGFGEVFQGMDEEGNIVAIKRLKLLAQNAAHRELDMAELLIERQLDHVVPIFDYGQDADSDSYFIVMPEADWNLQETIDDDKEITEDEAVEILLQIATGLSEVPDIVHRDLKPGNILYHEDKWKIADFGIARFVEASTSLRTLRDKLTAEYAAPEQWNTERTTSATDIYAIGCIGYALLTGRPPFSANTREEIKEQHLHEPPPTIEGNHPRLTSLLSMMLRKSPQARPNLERVQQVLTGIASTESDVSTRSGFDELAKVGEMAAQRAAEEEAKQRLEKSRYEKRKQLAQQASDILDKINEILSNKIRDQVQTAAEILPTPGGYELQIQDRATLRTTFSTMGNVVPKDAFPQSRWDVVAGAVIEVRQSQPKYEISASLWYTNRGLNQGYRWWEISYYAKKRQIDYQPFALDNVNADRAIGGRWSEYGVASGPTPIDDENVDDFCNRWAGILAKAYQGKLQHPSHLPLRGPLE